MNFKKFAIYAFVGVAVSATSCSKDNTPESPEEGGKGEMEVMTPVESKTFLGETANKFLNKFRAADQAEVIELASYFSDSYGHLDLPDAFYFDDDDEPLYDPAEFMHALGKGVAKGSVDQITRAVATYTYNINFDRLKGEYVPGIQQWVKKKDSNDIIFQFTDANGKNCEMKVILSGDTSDVDINWTEEWYDYYDNENYSEKYVYNISIPRTVKVSLTQGGKELANGSVKSHIDVKNHKVEADIYAKVANIEATAKMDGTDTKITQNSEMKVSGETLVKTTAQINGNKMCDLDAIQASAENEDSNNDDLLSYLHDGLANIDVMGDVQFYGTVTLNGNVIDALDNYFEYGYGTTQAEAEADADRAVSALNSNVTVAVKYNNKATTQATLTFKKKVSNWGNGKGYFYIEPLIKFESDNTTYSFEEYFERGFSSVEDTWDALISNYEKLWNK